MKVLSNFFRKIKAWPRALKVISGVMAVISMVLGISQVSNLVSRWSERRTRVAELVQTAEGQTAAKEYSEAWKSLTQALELSPDSEEVRTRAVGVGMAWLRDARVGELRSEKTFTQLTDKVSPLLYRAASGARGQLAGDLYAHLGWAGFLKWRDGRRDVEVTGLFEKAIQEDGENPYAHAMLGFWTLFPGSGSTNLSQALQSFATARKSGRELPYVRMLHLQALLNRLDQYPVELVRTADEMRRSGDNLPPGTRQRTLAYAYGVGIRQALEFLPRASSVLPAEEHLKTFLWLQEGLEKPPITQQLILAWLKQEAGDTVGALQTYQALRADADAMDNPALKEHVKRQIARLQP